MLLASLLALLPQVQGPCGPLHLVLRHSGSATETPAGLRVAVWFTKNGESFGRSEARTGERGLTELDLALPPEIAGAADKDRIVAHAELLESGWQHHEQIAVVDIARRRAEIQNFAFLRGGTLLGKVDAGAANAGSQVELYLVREDAPPANSKLLPFSGRSAFPAGRPFRVHFTEAGTYRLLARAEGVGSACVAGLELAPGMEPPAPFELQLAGDGAITGRFADPEGNAHILHPIWAVPRRLAPDEEVREAEFRSAPLDERGDGLRWCACSTDSRGEFRLAGLAPGRYWIYSGAPHEGGSALLREESVATGTEALQLVGGEPRLELRVLAADGSEARVDKNRPDVDEPGAAVLFCVRCPAGERPRPWADTPKTPAAKPFGPSRIFLVEPGARYVYACVRSGVRPVEGEVTIEAGAFRTVRELRLDAPGKSGGLELALVRPDGTPLARDFQVTVESLATGLPLFLSPRDTSGSRYQTSLPPGRYRLRVETEESVPWCGTGWKPAPAPLGAWTAPIEIAESSTTRREVRFWPGGKLRLALALPPGSPSRAPQWTRQYPTQTSPQEAGWLSLGTRGPGARVTLRPDPDGRALERAAGAPEPGAALEFGRADLHALYHYPGLLPGEEQTTHDWIPPGDYIVHVEARDFAPTEARLTIIADETASLRIELVPR